MPPALGTLNGMKAVLNSLTLAAVAAFLLSAGTAFAQRPPLNPDDVFVSEDNDSFDPGVPVGAQFPAIRALHQGQEIDNIEQFIRDKGAVFLAQRSVDW